YFRRRPADRIRMWKPGYRPAGYLVGDCQDRASGAALCSSVNWHSSLARRLLVLLSTSISPSIPRALVWTTKIYLSNGSLATPLVTRCRQAWLPVQEYSACLPRGLVKIGAGSLERCSYFRTCPIL